MAPSRGSESGLLRLWDLAVLLCVELYLRLRYRKTAEKVRRLLRNDGVNRTSVAHPRRITEKYFWRKVIDHDPRFTVACDKIAARRIVSDLGVEVALPRILWSGTDPALIPDQLLTADVVIKAAHGWEQTIFPAKDGLSPDEIRARCAEFMASSHGRRQDQWGYYHIPHRILIEERIYADRPMTDIKFHVYGENIVWVTAVYPTTGPKQAGIWQRNEDGTLSLSTFTASSTDQIDGRPLPAIVSAMAPVAQRIGAAFDSMRVDFMTDGETFYLGELTVYTAAGYTSFGHLAEPPGPRYWDIRRTWFLNTRQRGFWRIYAASLRRAIDREVARSGRPDASQPLAPAMLGLGL